MTNPFDLHIEPPSRNDVSIGGEGAADLQESLALKPPSDARNTPPVLTFERKRDVEIPWKELQPPDPIAAIRAHIETSWGDDAVKALSSNPAKPLLGNHVRALSNSACLYRTSFQLKDRAEKITQGFAIQFGAGVRWYLLVARPESPLEEKDFLTFEKYDAAWKGKIEGIEVAFENAVDAQTLHTEFQEIDLRPAYIARRYEELATLRKYAREVKKQVSDATTTMLGRVASSSMNADEIVSVQQRALQLEMGDYDVQRQIDKLVADAARLGFLLADRGRDLLGTDGKLLVKLLEGKLYTTCTQTVSWTEYVSVKPHWWSRRSTQSIAHTDTVPSYQEVDLTRDLVGERRAAWISEGKAVFLFEKTPTGLVASEGTPLRQVMDLCLQDEDFRRRCVVLLPVLEESLTGKRVLTKYAAFLRPLPGIVPASTPRLALAESLSYRTAWKGTHLGEMVSTINLGPGEERQVKITKKFDQETTVSHTSTSIFDISRAETNDLATEMENQTRREQEQSSSMECSAKASGSYLGFTAEASASAGTSSSLKDFSQAISKVAKKASQAVTQQSKQEVSTSSSSRTTVSNTDETTATLRNINQGRALNLMFHRLYNRFEGGLYLDGLRFEVMTGVESIAGSGVHESRSYALEELPRVVEALRMAGVGSLLPEHEFSAKVAACVNAVIEREYAEHTPAFDVVEVAAVPRTVGLLGSGMEPRVRGSSAREMTSVGKLRLPLRQRGYGGEPTFAIGLTPMAAPEEQGNASQATAAPLDVESLALDLRSATVLRREPMEPLTLLVPAGGLYLDTSVGVQPATEPYSERMRDEEVRLRQAEVYLKTSEGFLNQARATAKIAASDRAQRANGGPSNFVTGALASADQRWLVISLLHPLASGAWTLLVDGSERAGVEPRYVGQPLLQLTFDETQPWLREADLAARISLVEKGSGAEIPYVNASHPHA